MLSAEIEKIKAESISQVNAMRDHYSHELRALREEFLMKEQELSRSKNGTSSEFFNNQPLSKNASFKTATLTSPQNDSQAIIEELKNVKAERDKYY